ncbi:MAG: enolase C-terminal domain-like protein [Nitrososphaerota archaeon]
MRNDTIKSIEVYTVAVPIEAPLRHSNGVHPGWFTMTLIKITSSSGAEGWGEVGGGGFSVKNFLESIGKNLIGESIFNVQRIQWKYVSPITATYYNQLLPQIWFPIETALLDLQGKALGIPIHSLLGGKIRDEIEASAYIFPRYTRDGRGGETTPEEILKLAKKWKEKYGFKIYKLKAGVFKPIHDLDVLKLLNDELPTALFRVDPNGAWNIMDAAHVGSQLERFGVRMEYLEDPVWDMGNMARLRDFVKIPLATNTCVTRFEDLIAAHSLKAVDVILGDPHWWWGLRGYQQLGRVCGALGLTLGMHSPGELGIGLTAMVHAAASTPQLATAIDTHYMHLLDDVIKSRVEIINGRIKVPDDPGLGVEIDYNKIEKYQALYYEVKEYSYAADPARPEWYPIIPETSYAPCPCHK